MALYGIAGVRAAEIPGNGVIPIWVSVLAVTGWLTALSAGLWILFG